MIDPKRIEKEMEWMREMIEGDPEVRVRFDLNGDGKLDETEWEAVRQMVIHRLEQEQAEKEFAKQRLDKPHGMAPPPGESPVGGHAKHVFMHDIKPALADETPVSELSSMFDLGSLFLRFTSDNRFLEIATMAGSLVGSYESFAPVNEIDRAIEGYNGVLIDQIGGQSFVTARNPESGLFELMHEDERRCAFEWRYHSQMELVVFGRNERFLVTLADFNWNFCTIKDMQDRVVGSYERDYRVPFSHKTGIRATMREAASPRARAGIVYGAFLAWVMMLKADSNRRR